VFNAMMASHMRLWDSFFFWLATLINYKYNISKTKLRIYGWIYISAFSKGTEYKISL
jgi:hypothetical protein